MKYNSRQEQIISEKIDTLYDMLNNLNFDSSMDDINKLHALSNEVVMCAIETGAEKNFVNYALYLVKTAEQKGQSEQYPNLAMASIRMTKDILGCVA